MDPATTSAAKKYQAARPLQKDGRLHGVVVGLQRDDRRWLCIRRSQWVAAPLKVCFPGGAIEAGESAEQAVVREMREEVGLIVRPIAQCWKWEAADRPLTLWGWRAEVDASDSAAALNSLKPDEMEVAEVLWLTDQEVIDHPDAMPTNRDFVASLLQACR